MNQEDDRRSVSEGDDEALIRRAVLEMIKSTGRRPHREQIVRRFGLSMPSELTALDRLVAAGLIRRAAVEPGNLADDDEIDESTAGNRRQRPHPSRGPSIFGLKRILKSRDLSDREIVEAYREEFSRHMKAERAGLVGHTTSYLGVNVMLTVIWALTGAGFPWFLFPVLGWGIGYMSHRARVVSREEEHGEVMAVESPTAEQLRLHRRLWKVRRGWRTHFASIGMTSLLLGTTNVITGSSFPWALIPVGFMGIGLLGHHNRRRHREAQIVDELRDAGFSLADGASSRVVRRPGSTARSDESIDTSAIDEARSIRDEIKTRIDGMDDAGELLGDDFHGILDTYVEQIEQLSTTHDEVAVLIGSIAIADLDREHERLTERAASSANTRLQKEYEQSLVQVDRQRQSHSELLAEREIIQVRISTAINALKQLRIDVARAGSSHTRATDVVLGDLRRRSEELSRYLKDLQDAYDELE